MIILPQRAINIAKAEQILQNNDGLIQNNLDLMGGLCWSKTRQGSKPWDRLYSFGDISALKQRAEQNGYSTSDEDISLSMKAGPSLRQTIESGSSGERETSGIHSLCKGSVEPLTRELHKPVPLYELFEERGRYVIGGTLR